MKHAGCGAQLHLLLYVVILPLFNRKLRFEITTVRWKELQSGLSGDSYVPPPTLGRLSEVSIASIGFSKASCPSMEVEVRMMRRGSGSNDADSEM